MTSSEQQRYDIIIVGAGMVGTALACKLAQQNPALQIAVVEAQSFKPGYSESAFDPRVVALTLASQHLLDDIGVWPAIVATRICPYTRMHVWDGTGTGSIDFDCREISEPALGHIVENSIIVEALLDKLDTYNNVELLCPAVVSALNSPEVGGLTAIILEDGSTLRAPLLVATDGANSPVRSMANLNTREWDYGHTAIVATVTTELSHEYMARQRFTENGPLAFLPLQGETEAAATHCCSIVWSVKTARAKQLLVLDDDRFMATLAAEFEYKLGQVTGISERYSFPLRQRHCKDYFKPGIVVAGDAAHTIHPLAGQGVNLGLQDVQALAEEIHRAQQRQIPLSDLSILQRYQRRRKGPNLAMMAVMEGFKQLFDQDALPLRWLRNEGMKQVDRAGVFKSRIIREAMGL